MSKLHITVQSYDIAELNKLRGIGEESARRALLRVIAAAGDAVAAAEAGHGTAQRSAADLPVRAGLGRIPVAGHAASLADRARTLKIPEGEAAEQTICNHALATYKGCRELRYEVSTPTFDAIWQRTGVVVGRGTAKPRMVFQHGRHATTVFADDTVPDDEIRCLTADAATESEASPL